MHALYEDAAAKLIDFVVVSIHSTSLALSQHGFEKMDTLNRLRRLPGCGTAKGLWAHPWTPPVGCSPQQERASRRIKPLPSFTAFSNAHDSNVVGGRVSLMSDSRMCNVGS